MTRDEIIERLNWYPPNVSNTDTLIVKIESIVRIAEAAEREACKDAVRFADNGTEAVELIRARGEK
jgi:hypothetical protein